MISKELSGGLSLPSMCTIDENNYRHWAIAKRLRHGTLTPGDVGSNPTSPGYEKRKGNAMKYKIGTRVRVRKDLVVDKIYSNEDGTVHDAFVATMEVRCKKCAIVKGYEYSKYKLQFDGEDDIDQKFWTDGMLEKIEFNRLS